MCVPYSNNNNNYTHTLLIISLNKIMAWYANAVSPSLLYLYPCVFFLSIIMLLFIILVSIVVVEYIFGSNMIFLQAKNCNRYRQFCQLNCMHLHLNADFSHLLKLFSPQIHRLDRNLVILIPYSLNRCRGWSAAWMQYAEITIIPKVEIAKSLLFWLLLLLRYN